MGKKIVLDQSEILFYRNLYKSDGIHDSAMAFIHGHTQREATLEGTKSLIEAFFAIELEKIIRRKCAALSTDLVVDSNHVFPGMANKFRKHGCKNIRMQFDAHIRTSRGRLLAAYELKSIFGIGTSKSLVLRDLVRLAITKKLNPNVECLFVIVGLKNEMRDFFRDSKFPFPNNIDQKVKSPYSWTEIPLDTLAFQEKDYLEAMKTLEIYGIAVKLSRTQYGQKFHTMSYRVRYLKHPGYRPKSDFDEVSWHSIDSGDFVFRGGEPPQNIGMCDMVDSIDIAGNWVMFLTNDVDDQECTPIDPDETVWRYNANSGL